MDGLILTFLHQPPPPLLFVQAGEQSPAGAFMLHFIFLDVFAAGGK